MMEVACSKGLFGFTVRHFHCCSSLCTIQRQNDCRWGTSSLQELQRIFVGEALEMSYYPQFAALLNQQLAKLDRTPTWLARRLGVNAATVSRWLNEGTRPGAPEIIIRVADILGMDRARDQLLIAAGYGYQEPPVESSERPSHPSLSLLNTSANLGEIRPVRSNMPQPFTPFVGRTAEVAQLGQHLLNPACRLLTLAGPGGIGKSRLAIEFVRQLDAPQVDFADGLFFVSLIELSAPQQMSGAIAEVLELSFDGQQEVRSQLLNHLRDKKLLLLLDNFEHLHEGTELVSEILCNGPQVKVLVTSRTALGLPGEWYHPVGGLGVPEEGTIRFEKLADYDSVQLFQQCALRASPAFDLSVESEHVERICRLVEGMPLAIELAAAWLRLLPCARIAHEIKDNLAFLSSPLHSSMPRHRSMQFVLSQSWQMLTDHERDVMETLAIFQGGFDDAAATEVAQTDLITLAALAQKSMIRFKREHADTDSGRGRYNIHELLRQFVNLEAAQRPAAKSAAMQRFSHYYLHWVQRLTAQLFSAEQQIAMARIRTDFDNISAAWNWAVEHREFDSVALALDGLHRFCIIRGRIRESVQLLGYAVEQLQRQHGEPERVELLGHLLACLGSLYADACDSDHAIPLLHQSLTNLREPRLRAFASEFLGYAHDCQGDDAKVHEYLQESLAISRQAGDPAGQAHALHRLGIMVGHRGEYRQSKALGQEALTIYRGLQRPDRIAHVLSDLAMQECKLSEYAAATAHLQESLAIARRVGYRYCEAWALYCFAYVAWCEGKDADEARACTREAATLYHSFGGFDILGFNMVKIVQVLLERGSRQFAVQCAEEYVALARAFQNDELLCIYLAYLGNAQTANSDFTSARSSLAASLAMARSHDQVSSILLALYHFAEMLVHESRYREHEDTMEVELLALEWLVFLQHHPACSEEYKEKASRLQSEVTDALPAFWVAKAQVRGKNLNLDELVHLIVDVS